MGANHLDWPNCLNARDLGGLATADGRVRPGALIRSDSLQYLNGDGVALVRAAGVSRVLDLRNAHECEAFPTPFAA
ncbi:MAG: tyrosine-protein phosphatase, partial [Nocardioidaceae bacterium]